MNLITKIDENYLDTNNLYYQGNLELTKGLYCQYDGTIHINLNSVGFLFTAVTDTDTFIKEFSKTITHELTHKLIDELWGDETLPKEETLCLMVAEQI